MDSSEPGVPGELLLKERAGLGQARHTGGQGQGQLGVGERT